MYSRWKRSIIFAVCALTWAGEACANSAHPLFERFVSPDYPDSLLKERLVAKAHVDYDIHHDGSVGYVRVVEYTDRHIADIALSTVRQWRFKPWQVSEQRPAHVRESVLFMFDQEMREQGVRMLISWEPGDSCTSTPARSHSPHPNHHLAHCLAQP